MNKRFRAAIVGCGRMGGFIDDEMVGRPYFTPPYCHAGAYRAVPEVELVAAADIVPEKARALAERWEVPRWYTDYREMIQREQPEILSITTRPDTHAEILLFAAEQGVRAIYCEKPLCTSMEEADAMLRAVQERGIAFNLGVNRRFQEGYRRMRQLIQEGAIGELQVVSAYSSGSAYWTHSHTVDLLLFLAGDPTVQAAWGELNAEPSQWSDREVRTDPGVRWAQFVFANGVRGQMVSTSGYEFEAHGSRGKLRAYGNGAQFSWIVYDRQGVPEERAFPAFRRTSGAVECVRNLIAALQLGEATWAPIESSHRGQEMLHGLLESHRREGARVAFPLKDRGFRVSAW
ncbi:MAG: hypothetical protein KatS3mg115_0514 [Candidatus Poribacteria bacterium]|nr:MAG: hypothetical protein KatS3mg115_0514 [Candidatus Poribacteria bacterium]